MILRYSTPGSISTCMGIITLLMLMCLCAWPIQQGWSDSDIFLCKIIFIIAIIGIAVCFITKSYLRLGFTDALISILYVYFLIRYYTDASYPAETMAIHTTLAFALYFALRLIFSGPGINGNIIALLILAYSIHEAGYGTIQLFEGTSRHYRYPVTGSFHNPGPYSACLVMGLAIICTYIRYPELDRFRNLSSKWYNAISIINQFLILVFVSLIILTVSRTATIATALCLFILFWNYLERWKWWILGLCIAAGIGLYFLKSGSADGRMVINYVGAYAIADNPIFGNGIGSFFHRFAEATQKLSLSGTEVDLTVVDVIEYAFNDWLHIAVELGVVGFLLMAAIVVYTLCLLWKRCLPLFFILLVILTFSFFSYPLELLPYRVIAIMIIAFSASLSEQRQSKRSKSVIASTLITGCVAVCITASPSNRIKSLAKAENDYNMMRGIEDVSLVKDYTPLLQSLEGNRNFLFDYGRLLAKAGRYNDSNDILRRGEMISNDPMFLVVQGNNYRDMGAFDEAREMYLNAWHTMPNRIYPLYRLMLLYDQIGNKTKAMEYARIIVTFKEKVPSPAVSDIKKEALELINCK